MVASKFRNKIFEYVTGQKPNDSPSHIQNCLNSEVIYKLEKKIEKHPYLWKKFFMIKLGDE